MRTAGLKRVIRGSSPPRVVASVTVLCVMRSENAAISGATNGPCTTSTRACVGAGTGAGAVVGTVEAGAAAICGIAEVGQVCC
jgi:hypothetical protein